MKRIDAEIWHLARNWLSLSGSNNGIFGIWGGFRWVSGMCFILKFRNSQLSFIYEALRPRYYCIWGKMNKYIKKKHYWKKTIRKPIKGWEEALIIIRISLNNIFIFKSSSHLTIHLGARFLFWPYSFSGPIGFGTQPNPRDKSKSKAKDWAYINVLAYWSHD